MRCSIFTNSVSIFGHFSHVFASSEFEPMITCLGCAGQCKRPAFEFRHAIYNYRFIKTYRLWSSRSTRAVVSRTNCKENLDFVRCNNVVVFVNIEAMCKIDVISVYTTKSVSRIEWLAIFTM